MSSIVVCNGNFCRSRGATVEAFDDVTRPAGFDVTATHCAGFCLFGPVVTVADDDAAPRMLFQVYDARVQVVLDAIRTRSVTSVPQFSP